MMGSRSRACPNAYNYRKIAPPTFTCPICWLCTFSRSAVELPALVESRTACPEVSVTSSYSGSLSGSFCVVFIPCKVNQTCCSTKRKLAQICSNTCITTAVHTFKSREAISNVKCYKVARQLAAVMLARPNKVVSRRPLSAMRWVQMCPLWAF